MVLRGARHLRSLPRGELACSYSSRGLRDEGQGQYGGAGGIVCLLDSFYSVDMGVDRCHVGFLPHAYVQTGTLFDGVLCQASIFFLMHCVIRLPASII